MKNSVKLFFVFLLAVGVSSCMKNDSTPLYDGDAILAIEKPIIEQYIADHDELDGMVQYKETGIWYKIIQEGVKPEYDSEGKLVPGNGYYLYNINSGGGIEAPRVGVDYEGKLVATEVVFDKNNTGTADDKLFSLRQVIQGWQIAFLPKTLKDKEGKDVNVDGLTDLGLQQGSEIRIILPSPYGYQNRTDIAKIPANSPLEFSIKVLKVIPPAAPTSGN